MRRSVLSIVITLCFLGLAATPGSAYWAWGRTWASPSAARYIYGWSTTFSAAQKTIVARAASAYSFTAGSTLRVDGATFTSSLTALESAPFQITKALPSADFPKNTPGYTWRGNSDPLVNLTDRATVYLRPDWTWSNYFDLGNYVADFETVILHEFGHAHGLGHPFNDCEAKTNCPMTAAETASVMNSNATLKRILTSDDLAGLASIY